MKEYKDYLENTKYPDINSYRRVYVYSKGEVLWSGSPADYSKLSDLSSEVLVEKSLDREQYQNALNKYYKSIADAKEQYKKDAFIEAGADITNEQHLALWDSLREDFDIKHMSDKFYDYYSNIFL